jgi:hypothetical protein
VRIISFCSSHYFIWGFSVILYESRRTFKSLVQSVMVKTIPSLLGTLLLARMESGIEDIEKGCCEFTKEKTVWETLFISIRGKY